MKTTLKSLPPTSPERPVSPLALALALALRLRGAFPQVRQSATLLVQWLRAALGLQAGARSCAMAIDAELLAERDLIRQCTLNDPPAARRHIEQALDRIHAHHLELAAALDTPAPAKLLQD